MATHDELQTLMSVVPSLQVQEGTPYYDVLLQIIQEIGKEIRPTYTFNKVTCEKLKRHIQTAKILIKACQQEAENDKKKADAAIEAQRQQALAAAKSEKIDETETKN
uniref:Eukaryotic translation initiation factor 3 30 kDa subunit n=1 Tax=Caenorhabditis tropicalis TaxID=1561998 RepID=A0A1I7U3R9_9PELO